MHHTCEFKIVRFDEASLGLCPSAARVDRYVRVGEEFYYAANSKLAAALQHAVDAVLGVESVIFCPPDLAPVLKVAPGVAVLVAA